MRRLAFAALIACAALVGGFSYAESSWNPQPWIDDLAQAQKALETKYANLDWLEQSREVDLAALFADAKERLLAAQNDGEAKAAFERLIRRINDGHVSIDWPNAAQSADTSPPPAITDETGLCRSIGFDESHFSAGAARALPGYQPLVADATFPTGTVKTGGVTIGIVRISEFTPQDAPSLCEEAVRALKVAPAQPCDEDCQDKIYDEAYRRLTALFEDRLLRFKQDGVSVLMVDITNNGGGSEWAEAAARMLSPRQLVSERVGFVRGPHWVKHWSELADRLRDFAKNAPTEYRSRLLEWARQADAAKKQAEKRCRTSDQCPWLGQASYATGLVGAAPAGEFKGEPWGPDVFSPAQYAYRDGVWDGPVIVLVNEQTWSAAEEFASVLQDNGAALILGARTGGAGCGHTNGGTPTRLKNSGATLELPDCARFRLDGSNEVNGVMPDQLIAWRATDGSRFQAKLLKAALPQAVDRAATLYRLQTPAPNSATPQP